jgi:ribokinase
MEYTEPILERQARGRVVVVGSANMDLVVRSARLPGPGETVLGGDLLRVPGGKGANQAVAAARLGAAVRFVGALGTDPFGDELLAALQADHVDVSAVMRSERPSGAALIVVDDDGENLIAVAPGANAALEPDTVRSALADLAVGDVVQLQLEIPPATVRAACESARQHGARTVLNAAPAGGFDLTVLALVDVLVVNGTEATLLSQQQDPAQAAHALRGYGPGAVIVTLGANGLLLEDERGTLRVAAHHVDVVDATAAGDAFCGGVGAALARGMDLHRAVTLATAAAALSTTRAGAQPSLPYLAEVEARLQW